MAISRLLMLVVGVLGLLMGLLWIGQGMGYVRWPATSFMIDEFGMGGARRDPCRRRRADDRVRAADRALTAAGTGLAPKTVRIWPSFHRARDAGLCYAGRRSA